jgi:hypothetical protein
LSLNASPSISPPSCDQSGVLEAREREQSNPHKVRMLR